MIDRSHRAAGAVKHELPALALRHVRPARSRGA